MSSSFSAALADAESHHRSQDRVDSIKTAVAREIRQADPSLSVKFTDYFNHTAAPDMVLSWPRTDAERLVYVRPSANIPWLSEDLSIFGRHHPLVFLLEELGDIESGAGQWDVEEIDALAASASALDTWIADPSAVEEASTVRGEGRAMGLVSQALVRGGRGLATGGTVSHLVQTTAAGFAGAQAQDGPTTSAALNEVSDRLNPAQAGRLTRVLRAIWEGHGGSLSAFPTSQAVGALTDDDLTYLLSTLEAGSTDFWRRIGRSISTAQLGGLSLDDPCRNLEDLVNANLDSLQAKGVRVVSDPIALGEPEETPRWTVRRGCLALRGPNWSAFVAARKVEELPPAEEAKPMSLSALRSRAVESRVAVTQVRLRSGDRSVTYEADDRVNVIEDPGLDRVSVDVGGGHVERATVVLNGGGTLVVDLLTSTASAPTNSTAPLSDALLTALPLMPTLSEVDVNSSLRLVRTGDTHDQLFDDGEDLA